MKNFNSNNIFKYRFPLENPEEDITPELYDNNLVEIIEETIMILQDAVCVMENPDYIIELSIANDKIFFKANSDLARILNAYGLLLDDREDRKKKGEYNSEIEENFILIPGEDDRDETIIEDTKAIRKLVKKEHYSILIATIDETGVLLECDRDIERLPIKLENRKLQKIRKNVFLPNSTNP